MFTAWGSQIWKILHDSVGNDIFARHGLDLWLQTNLSSKIFLLCESGPKAL